MGKVKQWASDEAHKKVDEILDNYKQGTYNFDETKTKLLKVDNIELVDIDETNVDDNTITNEKGIDMKLDVIFKVQSIIDNRATPSDILEILDEEYFSKSKGVQ